MFRDFPELKPSKGKFRIIGIDKFEIPGEGHWVVGDFDDREEAVKKSPSSKDVASLIIDEVISFSCPCAYCFRKGQTSLLNNGSFLNSATSPVLP